MKRLFVAIKVLTDEDFLEQVHQLEEALRHEKIKWVEDHNIHITLKFLGETDEKKIPAISGVLKNIAALNPSFIYRLTNLGIFGSRYDPRVVWIGIEPYKELVSLMTQIREALIPLGFPADRQNLVPHLTLGRIKNISDKPGFQQTIEEFRSISTGEMRAEKFILYESILRREGPTYVALANFPFSLRPQNQ